MTYANGPNNVLANPMKKNPAAEVHEVANVVNPTETTTVMGSGARGFG